MTEFAAALVVFVLVMLGLGLGALAGRAPLRGSCGGLGGCAGCKRRCGDAKEEP